MTHDEMIQLLRRSKPRPLRRLAKLMTSEEAYIDGRVDDLREELIRWLDETVPDCAAMAWIEMEGLVEAAAEETNR